MCLSVHNIYVSIDPITRIVLFVLVLGVFDGCATTGVDVHVCMCRGKGEARGLSPEGYPVGTAGNGTSVSVSVSSRESLRQSGGDDYLSQVKNVYATEEKNTTRGAQAERIRGRKQREQDRSTRGP